MSDHRVPELRPVAPPGALGVLDSVAFDNVEQESPVGAILGERCPFSQRQVEMVQWLANGKTALEISRILGLSIWTVQKYLDRAKQAAGVRKDTALVATALRNGWIA